MRPDGKKVKATSPMYQVVPYIMPKRYDAQNFVNLQVDEESIREYLREKRSAGIRMDHMTVMIAAYLRTCANHPVLNRFVMNRRIYQRNHFCVSFVILKSTIDGGRSETVVKVYLDPDDDIFTVHQKLQEAIRLNSEVKYSNTMDKFVGFMLSLPGLARFIVAFARLLDNYGLLPGPIINLSPFHTSMFITNLASINTNYIYHHLYDFGTTSIFIAMGKIVPDYRNGRDDRKVMPLGVVMDERIADGYDFSRMFVDLKKYLKNPSLLEMRRSEEIRMKEKKKPKEAAHID